MKSTRALPFLLLWLSHAGLGLLRATDPLPSPELKRTRLHVIASESMFATVNKGDAVASLGIWIKQLGAVRGFQCDTRVEITPSIEQMRQALAGHSVDLLLLDTPDYLTLAKAGLVQAVAVGTSRGRLAAFEYLLLTNNVPGGMQLAGLRGKRITVASRTKSNMGLVWLETLLSESGLERAASFFGSVDLTNRASSCVLPLFFGKIDACVVDSGNFESASELNPQLGRLSAAAHSEALLEGLLAMPIVPRHPQEREVIDSILNLHKTTAGGQLGIVFKVGPQMRPSVAQFASMASLCSRYRLLLKLPGDGLQPVAGRLDAVKERH